MVLTLLRDLGADVLRERTSPIRGKDFPIIPFSVRLFFTTNRLARLVNGEEADVDAEGARLDELASETRSWVGIGPEMERGGRLRSS